MKKRILFALTLFVILSVLLLPPLALDLHHIFLQQLEELTWKPWTGWQAVLQGGMPLRFYLLLMFGLAFLLFWVIASGSYIQYQSGMIRVTPYIATPEPAGQGQYGTARWARERELRRYYAVAAVRGDLLSEWIEAGRKDYEEVENANVKIN